MQSSVSQKGGKVLKIRSIVPIYYSTTTNTAKNIAYTLANKLEDNGFVSIVNNIGEYDKEEFLQQTGPVVLVMATYGNGGSPQDGQDFRLWVEGLQGNSLLEKIQFSILALGNITFQHFCGNGRAIRECFLKLGAKELNEIQLCNSASTDNTAEKNYPAWSDKLIESLVAKYNFKEVLATEINKKFKVKVIEQENENWEEEYNNRQIKGSQISNYLSIPKAKVIDIKQLRKQNDGRSTLWIRTQIPQGMKLQPACNINVFPQNVREPNEEKWKGSVQIVKFKKDQEIETPPVLMEDFWKLTNFSQLASINLVKSALKLSNEKQEILEKYQRIVSDPQHFSEHQIRCKQLYQDLKPDYSFLAQLGLNTVRPYTLASWDPKENYCDLVVSLAKNGLTSRYFQSMPKQIRISPIQSTFYVPQGRPIVMIANGSGIAPFRSLTEYILSIIPEKERKPITLYFGIQNRNNDFYFGDEWTRLEEEGKIKLRIAESRKEQNKVYVQNLITEDKQFIKEHLFTHKGVIFICGGGQMAKSVDTELFEAIKLHEKMPFKAFKLTKQLEKNRTIVKEVFH